MTKTHNIARADTRPGNVLFTTAQVGERLGITSRRVRALIGAGRLPAQKVGRDWLIAQSDLETFAPQPTGYPKGRPRGTS